MFPDDVLSGGVVDAENLGNCVDWQFLIHNHLNQTKADLYYSSTTMGEIVWYGLFDVLVSLFLREGSLSLSMVI